MANTYDTGKVSKLQEITQQNGFTATEEKDAKDLLARTNGRLSTMEFKYWTPKEDIKVKGKTGLNITIGKRYDILLDNGEALYIVDDSGRPSAIFEGHEGKFE